MSNWYDRAETILLLVIFIMLLIIAFNKSNRIENPTPNSITILEGKITSLETRVKNLESRK